MRKIKNELKMKHTLKTYAFWHLLAHKLIEFAFASSLIYLEKASLDVYGGHGEKGVIVAYLYPGTKSIVSARL